MRQPEFLRFPNLRNLTLRRPPPARACYLTSPTVAANCLVNPDPRHPPSSAKVCRPCWRGPACARRARLPACEMAPCRSPRYVESPAPLARPRLPPPPLCPSHDRIDDDARPPNCARTPAPSIHPASELPRVPSPKLIPRLCQRAASSSSSGSTAESPLRLNIAAAAATAVAASSIAWYYHLYGPTADATAPAEEG